MEASVAGIKGLPQWRRLDWVGEIVFGIEAFTIQLVGLIDFEPAVERDTGEFTVGHKTDEFAGIKGAVRSRSCRCRSSSAEAQAATGYHAQGLAGACLRIRVAVAGARNSERVGVGARISPRVKDCGATRKLPDPLDPTGFGGAAGKVRQPGVGVGEAARRTKEIIFLLERARQGHREAVFIEITKPGDDADFRVFAAAAAGGRAVRGGDLDALEVLAQNEVDDTGDGIAAVHARSAILKYFDTFNRTQRNGVDIHVLPTAGKEGQATAVDQYQRLVGAQPAQRHR